MSSVATCGERCAGKQRERRTDRMSAAAASFFLWAAAASSCFACSASMAILSLSCHEPHNASLTQSIV